MDRSHRQQTPLFPRPPSPTWTGLTASKLPSSHACPPPHGQVSPPEDFPLPALALPRMGQVSPPADSALPALALPRMGQVSSLADSPLPALALPRMDRSHRQQTPLFPRPPSPAWTSLTASRLPLHRAAQSVSVRESVIESVYQPLSPHSPSPAWTGLITSRLPSPRARPPRMGQVSSPADSSLHAPSPAWTDLTASGLPSPTWTGLPASRLPSPHPASPAWTGLIASRLPNKKSEASRLRILHFTLP